MSDVFISYAHSTAAQAGIVADALKALGYRVWRDDELPVHRAYADVIAERVEAAKAVVVIWSADAVQSEWVRSEADKARADHKLVQLNLDGAELPMPFDQIRCVDMAGWTGDADDPAWRTVVGSVAALVGAVSAPAAGRRAEPAGLSICVLPFTNMSLDPEQDYFSDGISEDIITDLSKVSALAVVARNTAFTFKARAVDVRKVGRELGVTYVLEGSVRKSEGRVRITAQLIDADKGSHIWAERWDRDFTNIFALQDEISQAVVAALKLKLLPAEKKAIQHRGTTNPDAYNLYLMARQMRASGNEGDRRREEEIIRLTRRATRIDPDYAQAWALMARAQTVLKLHFAEAGEDGLAAAERALALDPNLAEAHAIKAQHLAKQGKPDEALAELQTALRLDPDSWEANKQAGLISFREHRLEDAIRYYRKTTGLMETDFASPMMLITCFTALGDRDAAMSAARTTLIRAEKAIEQDQSNGSAMATGCVALAFLGEIERARDWARRALLIDPHNMVMRYNLACALSAHLADVEGAVELLEPFFATADEFWLSQAKVDPDFNPLREDERFKAMVESARERLDAKGGSAMP
jgi:adenylate cyclase